MKMPIDGMIDVTVVPAFPRLLILSNISRTLTILMKNSQERDDVFLANKQVSKIVYCSVFTVCRI